MSYLKGAGATRSTPQSEPIPGKDMVANSAGGFAYATAPLERIRRFLILGSEGGTYYASEKALTAENAGALRAAFDELGPRAVEEIVAISDGGRAPKNDVAIFALAMACGHPNEEVRARALGAIPLVCRTGTHLFMFMEFVQDFRGWGRALKRAVGEWYVGKEPERLAYQLVKYRQRNGWSHRDVLRLAKPRPERGSETDDLLGWAVGKNAILGEGGNYSASERVGGSIEGFVRAQAAPDAKATAALVREYGGALPREGLITEHLNDPEVWRALLDVGMPLGAMIRNLPTMTRHGVIEPMGDYTKLITDALRDPAKLGKARIHPLNVLNALGVYSSGQSMRGQATWGPVREIIDALDDCFYASFGFVEASGKRTMIALDLSASMTWPTTRPSGFPALTARDAAAAMSMVTARTESQYMITGFTSGHHSRGGRWGAVGSAIGELNISPRQRLDDVVREIEALPAGGTDCALPMLAALERKINIDTFIIYTDNETWAGEPHPSQALVAYREKMQIPDARLIVVGMASNGFTIADPADGGMLDVVGFDTAAPQVMAEFSAGRV